MSQHAIRAANAAFYAAFERLDYDAMAALWACEVPVSCVHPGWDLVLGYEAVLQSWRAIFDGTSDIHFRSEDAQITAGPHHGWVISREFLTTTVQGLAIENTLSTINTFVFESGTWRIAHHHAAPVLQGKPRTPRRPEVILH